MNTIPFDNIELSDLNNKTDNELSDISTWAKKMSMIGSARRSLRYTKLYCACDKELKVRKSKDLFVR